MRLEEFTNGFTALGDCIEVMQRLPPESVDAVIADPPYGTTQCKWDAIVPLDQMWGQVRRVTGKRSPVLLFATKPFSAAVIMSNPTQFRYDWIYEKTAATGHLNAKKMPMRAHEEVLVFYESLPTYNAQKTFGHERKTATRADYKTEVYNPQSEITTYDSTERYPRSVLRYASDKQTLHLHPTQKPVELLRYLIRTYTQPNEVILDFTMGAGTTCVAAVEEGRKFIGIEKDPTYFETACKRIHEAENGNP